MDRRGFLKTSAAAGALVSAAGVNPAAAFEAPKRRPNVLYVFSDQHRAATMPGEPFNTAVAPNLDAFRKANFSMDRCISNYPLCTPYRGMFLSGRWPYQTGITHNGTQIRNDEISLGRVFRDQGYHTGYVGKWHLQGPGVRFIPAGPERQGFEDWHVWERTNNHYSSWTYDQETGEKVSPKGWNCTRMTDQAIDFLEKQPESDKPWLLVVSWNPPHPPFNPPEEDQAIYTDEMLKDRPNVRVPNPDGPPAVASEEAFRKAMRGYYGGVTGVDLEFARLLKTLEETGQAGNTIVVYTSDHGEMMGAHGRMAKSVPFEESCHVPFYVRYPGVTKDASKSDTLFAAVDIYPTMCGLAGVPVPKHCVGRDMSAVMKGGEVPLKVPGVFLMNQVAGDGSDNDEGGAGGGAGGGKGKKRAMAADAAHAPGTAADFTTLPNYRGIRTDTHTYAVAETGRWLLFDNIADPYQMKNLIGDAGQAPLIKKLDDEIAAWLKRASDPFPYAQAITKTSSFPH
jgi:arylsulfatase A-like enzyme